MNDYCVCYSNVFLYSISDKCETITILTTLKSANVLTKSDTTRITGASQEELAGRCEGRHGRRVCINRHRRCHGGSRGNRIRNEGVDQGREQVSEWKETAENRPLSGERWLQNIWRSVDDISRI